MAASLVAAMQETRVQTLGQENPLEKEMASHSRIPAWRIPWTEELGGPVHGVTKNRTQLSNKNTNTCCGQDSVGS